MNADRFGIQAERCATLLRLSVERGFPYGVSIQADGIPRLISAGWDGLDVFNVEAGLWAFWEVLNRTPYGWDRKIDRSPVGMRLDDPRWNGMEWSQKAS